MSNPSFSNPTERDCWYDNAKAFLVLTVVIGHLIGDKTVFSASVPWIFSLQKFITIFHMPAFMILSGKFAKGRIQRREYAKVLQTTILPYCIAQTLMLGLYAILDRDISSFSFLNPYFGLWYILALGIYILVTPFLLRFRWLLPASFLVSLCIGFTLDTQFPLSNHLFSRLFTYYPFFLFGYTFSDFDFPICRKRWFRVCSAFGMMTMAVLTLVFRKNISLNLLSMNTSYHTIASDYETSIWIVLLQQMLHILVAFASFFMIMALMPTKRTFFTYVGVNSFYVYILHLFVAVFTRTMDSRYEWSLILDNKWKLLAYLLCGVLLTFVLASKPVKKVFQPILQPKISFSKIADLFRKDK